MQQQDSYSDFMPLRQSSLLTDETLLMNGTDVYANVTVIWPAGHQARELELERARIEFESLRNGVPYVSMCDSLITATLPNSFADTLANDTIELNNDKNNEDTIWLTALDISASTTEPINDTMFEAFHTVLDFSTGECDEDGEPVNSELDEQISLNDTLPMDDDDETMAIDNVRQWLAKVVSVFYTCINI